MISAVIQTIVDSIPTLEAKKGWEGLEVTKNILICINSQSIAIPVVLYNIEKVRSGEEIADNIKPMILSYIDNKCLHSCKLDLYKRMNELKDIERNNEAELSIVKIKKELNYD